MRSTLHVAPAQGEINNRLLALLPEADYDRVRPHLTRIELANAQILHLPEEAMEYAFFPESAVLSYVFNTEDGVPLEVGTVGNNGVANVAVALGTWRTPNSTEVLLSGTALRIASNALYAEARRGEMFAALLHAYAQAATVHAGHSQVCMRLHSFAERLAGWLVLLHDFNCQDRLPLTQHAIGQMLGVPRSGVSATAGQLQAAGLIDNARGMITIRDRQALADFACDCLKVIRDEYEHVFSSFSRSVAARSETS